jgi:glycosyltransferase involved in cell wall biosynthesis
MTKTPLVSIITPVYNNEEYIREALESIIIQNFKDFEAIIIDDYSSDNSYSIITEYKDRDNRFKIFKNPRRTGAGDTRNFGLNNATGKYIAVFDSDDIMFPQRLSKQLNFMEKDDNIMIGVCGSNVELIDNSGKVLGIKKFPEGHDACIKSLFYRSPFCHSSTIIRKQLFQDYGYYISDVAHDYDLWFRLHDKTHFHNLQDILVKYRLHNKNISVDKIEKQYYTISKARKKLDTSNYKVPFFSKIYFIIGGIIIKFIPNDKIFSIYNKVLTYLQKARR